MRYFSMFCLSLLCAPILIGQNSTPKNLLVHLVVWRGLTEAEEGFQEELKQLGYDVSYKIFNAAQSKENLKAIVASDVIHQGNPDYIYTFGTTVSKTIKDSLQGRTPQLFNIVAAPLEAQLVNSLEEPGNNIAGTSNSTPLKDQIANARAVFPFKKLGVIYNREEANSRILVSKLKDLSKGDFALVGMPIPADKSRLATNIDTVMKSTKVDAVYLPADSFLASNSAEVIRVIEGYGAKTIAGIEKFIDEGALLGTVASYRELGKLTAHIIHEHREGRAFGKIPVKFQQNAGLVVNMATLKKSSLKIPQDLKVTVSYIEQ